MTNSGHFRVGRPDFLSVPQREIHQITGKLRRVTELMVCEMNMFPSSIIINNNILLVQLLGDIQGVEAIRTSHIPSRVHQHSPPTAALTQATVGHVVMVLALPVRPPRPSLVVYLPSVSSTPFRLVSIPTTINQNLKNYSFPLIPSNPRLLSILRRGSVRNLQNPISSLRKHLQFQSALTPTVTTALTLAPVPVPPRTATMSYWYHP